MNLNEEPWVSGRISMDSQRHYRFIDKLSGESIYVCHRSEVRSPDHLTRLILDAQERHRLVKAN